MEWSISVFINQYSMVSQNVVLSFAVLDLRCQSRLPLKKYQSSVSMGQVTSYPTQSNVGCSGIPNTKHKQMLPLLHKEVSKRMQGKKLESSKLDTTEKFSSASCGDTDTIVIEEENPG